ncbi:MAG TPA: hypothetical protein VLE95_07915 [Chlamydiales bacterium]|nr:hypothetical protein [Chlamydiales bacterium]
MKIQTLSLYSYEVPLTNGQMRSGILLNITDEKGNDGWGEIAPLPRSKETLEDSLQQLHQKQEEIIKIDWTARSCLKELAKLRLLPAVSFGLESALFSILKPLSEYTVSTSALLMGSPQEIFEQAKLRHEEGYISAKLKVSNLTFEEAAFVINELKDKFRLRIDVNRAWKTADSLLFFSQFPLYRNNLKNRFLTTSAWQHFFCLRSRLAIGNGRSLQTQKTAPPPCQIPDSSGCFGIDTFDYVEEPFQNPNDLAQFPHPLAVDESFPQDLSLAQLESFPTLKALIYKPTIQGGILGCLSLHEWTRKRGISLVLSSSFESDLGLAHVASIAHRLSLSTPIGIGTYHHLNDYVCSIPLQFSRFIVHIPQQLRPKMDKISSIENRQMLKSRI